MDMIKPILLQQAPGGIESLLSSIVPFFADYCNILFFNIKTPAKKTKGKSETS